MLAGVFYPYFGTINVILQKKKKKVKQYLYNRRPGWTVRAKAQYVQIPSKDLTTKSWSVIEMS